MSDFAFLAILLVAWNTFCTVSMILYVQAEFDEIKKAISKGDKPEIEVEV